MRRENIVWMFAFPAMHQNELKIAPKLKIALIQRETYTHYQI